MEKRPLMVKVGLLFIALFAAPMCLAAYSENRDFHLTPSMLFGVPHPINFALDAKIGRKFSGGITGGYFGFTYKGSEDPIRLTLPNYELRARWHAFGGACFLGGAIGYHSATATASKKITASGVAVQTEAKLTIKGVYVTPHAGWMWIWESGFSLGLEIGLQVPVSPSSAFAVTYDRLDLQDAVEATTEFKTLKKNVDDLGKTASKIPLPLLTLLRIGWTF